MKKLLWKWLGYHECPICKQQTVEFVKDILLYEDEPPMFGHWQCFNKECLASTDVESTEWADKVAQEKGYKTYKQALEESYKRGGTGIDWGHVTRGDPPI